MLLVDRKTGQRLELNWFPKGSSFAVSYADGEGLDHLGFPTGHAAEIARAFEAHGGKIALRPSDPNGVRQNFYVATPDVNWIELMAFGSARLTSARRSTTRGKPRPSSSSAK